MRVAPRFFYGRGRSNPIAEIERLEAAVLSGCDGAIGSRAVRAPGCAGDRRWYRAIDRRAFHFLVSTLTVRGYRDTQCGFKLFNAPVAQDLFSRIR